MVMKKLTIKFFKIIFNMVRQPVHINELVNKKVERSNIVI